MGLTGKYDFKGIQKAANVAVDAALATTAWGAWIIKSPFHAAETAIVNLAVNWLTNKGLIILNIPAIIIDGKFDQKGFDTAMDEGIRKARIGGTSLTPEQGKAIDDAVRKAFDKNADLGATPHGLPIVSTSSVRSGSDPSL